MRRCRSIDRNVNGPLENVARIVTASEVAADLEVMRAPLVRPARRHSGMAPLISREAFASLVGIVSNRCRCQ